MNLLAKVGIYAALFAVLENFALSNEFSTKCPEYNPQTHLDIELISGLWFGSEMITHYENRAYAQVFDTCVIVQLEEIREWGDYNYDYDETSMHNSRRYDYNQHRYHFIKLEWNESGRSAEYTLKFNSSRRGLWIGSEPPKGSVLRKHYHHSHFSGTVQVMKAVGNHLVLTFCEKGELFTIILTRVKNVLEPVDVESVHALLTRRGLAVQAVRELCRHNSAIRLTTHTAIVFTLMAMLLMGN